MLQKKRFILVDVTRMLDSHGCSVTSRDPTRDGWIKEFIKWKWSSGLFWAVSRGSREKKPPNCHKYATFWGGFFNFLWEKNKKIIFAHKKLKNHPKKLQTNGSWELFSLQPPTAQNSHELQFRFINSFIQPSLVGSLVSMLPKKVNWMVLIMDYGHPMKA